MQQIGSCCRAAEGFGYNRLVQGILFFLFFLFPQIKETKREASLDEEKELHLESP